MIVEQKIQFEEQLIRVFGKNKTCKTFNFGNLLQKSKQLVQATSNKANGLRHIPRLAKEAIIRLIENLWT